MRLSYIITSVNLWFARLVNDKDVIDDKLRLLSLTASGSISQIPVSIANFFIWLSRKILTGFMLTGYSISKIFVRQIEFEADECSVHLAGFESFKSSLIKLDAIADASVEAFSQLKTQKNPNDNSLPDDFILLISTINRKVADKDYSKPKKSSSQENISVRTVYPSNQERIEHVRNLVSKDMFQSDKPASSLFTNFEELTKMASMRFYRETLGLRFDKEDLVPTNKFDSTSGQGPDTAEIDSNFF